MSYLDEIRKLEESDKKFIWHPFTQMKDWLKEKPYNDYHLILKG